VTESLLVRGDNLRVLRALAREMPGRFRLAYVDPPYNTGRTFAEYVDRRAPDAWREMMAARLPLVRELLSPDGALALDIDDTELGASLELGDAIFGRENRVSLITIVRSATTGHKARNAGPVNVTSFLVLWARDRRAFRPAPLVRARSGRDRAYSTWIENPEAPPSRFTFAPLGLVVARALGHASAARARRALGAAAWEAELERFALAHAERVVRFAQVRVDAVSRAAQQAVERSRGRDEPLVLKRAGYTDMVLVRGNRMLRLADKVRSVDGAPCIVEPLTNVWDDLGFQGIAREGGVRFERNKKPERMLQRVLELCTEPGDWVLDPFAGSGTTAAVALKTGRRFVTVEKERALFEAARGRLERVVRGEDPTGITRAVRWEGGGGFAVRRAGSGPTRGA
jgi:adenine-specific DNA-methyltransferase